MAGPTVGRIADRSSFRELRRPSGRGARGPVRVSFVPGRPGPAGETPQVAYAIGRRCGNAVTRNRVRRRLRAAVAQAAGALPPGRYLVAADSEAATLGFTQLTEDLSEAMRAAAGAKGARR